MSETVAAAAAEAAPAFSRVTLLGRGQRADLVLPSTEPSGALLPDILTLLGGSPTDRGPSRLSLVTSTGIPIPPDMSLAGVGVLDGAVLRLVDDDALPPPPVVHDVTEETAADLERHRGRFSPVSRAVVIVSLTATGAAMASIEVLIGLSATRAFTV
ncbi:MAG: EsaB/YukD family protein, partial [Actinomycetota bacterium]|nr:EsaB/YukD family protein [Actinomycetota bacterium]